MSCGGNVARTNDLELTKRGSEKHVVSFGVSAVKKRGRKRMRRGVGTRAGSGGVKDGRKNAYRHTNRVAGTFCDKATGHTDVRKGFASLSPPPAAVPPAEPDLRHAFTVKP